LNKPGEEVAFHKSDCGKLTDVNRLFGMAAGAYQGAEEGSTDNNFILRMSQQPDSIGIALLAEIKKVSRGVIHGLYKVLDKGKRTNKNLVLGSAT
jgi:ATP-dependent Clp protease ATP-binding subunit ClpA